MTLLILKHTLILVVLKMCWLRVFHNRRTSLQNKNTCSIVSLSFLQNAQQCKHFLSKFVCHHLLVVIIVVNFSHLILVSRSFVSRWWKLKTNTCACISNMLLQNFFFLLIYWRCMDIAFLQKSYTNSLIHLIWNHLQPPDITRVRHSR